MSLPRPPPLPLHCFGLALHCASRRHAGNKYEVALRAFCLTQPARASSGVGCACGSDIRREAPAEQSRYTPHRLTSKGELTSYKTLEIPAHTRLRMTVDASGINISRPKSLKRISPGKRPKPNFCSQGVTALISSNAKKTTMSQRVMSAT